MRILFLCGVFAEENEQEIIDNAKRPIEYSANVMQKKLIHGFRQCECDLDVISAPFIGSYPNASRIRNFKGFTKRQIKYQYVYFNNIWGLRNFSRASSLKKAIGNFVESSDLAKMIVVYSPHTPFLEAAVYAKRKDSSIKICLILPDLPHYMNLDSKISMLYRIGKKIDINKFNRLNQQVDSYMLLTEAMKEKVDIQGKPYIVAEGVINSDLMCKNEEKEKEKSIVYTGKLSEKFGVKNLVDAFMQFENPKYKLILCGRGDIEDYVSEKSKEDSRIVYLGQVTPEEAQKWILQAAVLVNPRQNNDEYTKYSFPSKNIEYLLSGKPVVAYMLDGIPQEYSEFMYVVQDNSIESLVRTIELALGDEEENINNRYLKAREYLRTLTSKEIAHRLLTLTFG